MLICNYLQAANKHNYLQFTGPWSSGLVMRSHIRLEAMTLPLQGEGHQFKTAFCLRKNLGKRGLLRKIKKADESLVGPIIFMRQ